MGVLFDPEADNFRSSSYLKFLKDNYGDTFPVLLSHIKNSTHDHDLFRKKTKGLNINLVAYKAVYDVQKHLFSGEHDDMNTILDNITELPVSLTEPQPIVSMIKTTLQRLNEIKMFEDLQKNPTNENLAKSIDFLANLMVGNFIVDYVKSPNLILALSRLGGVRHVGENLIFNHYEGPAISITNDARLMRRIHADLEPKTLIHFEPTTNFEKVCLAMWLCMNFNFGCLWYKVNATGKPAAIKSSFKKVALITTLLGLLLSAFIYYKYFMARVLPKVIPPPPVRPKPVRRPPPPKFDDFKFEVANMAPSALYRER